MVELLPEAARSWIEDCRPSAVASLEPLAGGAGARRYVRVHLADGGSVIWMLALSEEAELLPPALREAQAELPFVTMTKLLAEAGLPVPELYAVAKDERWVLLEDLGDRRLCDVPRAERVARQHEAIELLARVHGLPRGNSLPFTRLFDEEWIRFELAHFVEYGAPPDKRERLTVELEALISEIAGLPRTLCLRDFQSQNLMIDTQGRLRILDYQDALLAPPELDLAALLYDSYVEISDDEREELLAHYSRCRGERPEPGRLGLLVVQRKCKDFARFRYLTRVKHDTRFERYVSTARRAVLSTLPALPPRLSGLRTALEQALRPDPK